MKLIIQVPCYNEADTLGVALKSLPRQVAGFDRVEWLVIDDGSSDHTAEVARSHGADHIVRFLKNQGLARAFTAGLEAAIKAGADVIVNTDADNQYDARDIPKLVQPILSGQADMTVGVRAIAEIRHFSRLKKKLQKMGSWVVRRFSRTDIQDATSGFRALSRDAALKLNVFNDYTYTLETLIQGGQKNMVIQSVPIRVNPELRPSRLIKSVFSYIKKSVATIIRISIIYKPFRFFMTIGLGLFSLGLLIGLRFLYFYFGGEGQGHVQSLILASILLGFGFQTILIAFISDLLATNRKLMEDVQYRLKKIEHQKAQEGEPAPPPAPGVKRP
jgi:glycosyltransferase involved in cell wall biosynthesis